MSERIALITDSTCDIPAEWLEKYDIDIVPLTIVWDERQYLDGVELSVEEFYEHLGKDEHHPTTSQPSPQSFLSAYQKAVEKGYQEIIVLTISSAMSGTMESALRAGEESTIPVHVVDSRNNSMGLGWQVIAAARARERGGDMQAMLKAAKQARENMVYYISLDTLEYLSKGGRIGDAVAFLGSVLKIKPLICVKPDTGTVGASSPGRSRKSAINGLYRQFFKQINTDLPMHITVLHNAAFAEAQALAERVQKEYHPKELFIQIVSPVLGVHTGKGALALCGYGEE